MVGITDLEMPCPLPGCTEVVQKSDAMQHARHVHPELTKSKERVACPKCALALQGENYAKHYVSHFPSYVCPYGCGMPLSRVTVSDRKRHYSSCRTRLQTGLAWEEADALAMQMPVFKKFDGGGNKNRQYVKTTKGPVAVEDLEPESEEECLSISVQRNQHQSAPVVVEDRRMPVNVCEAETASIGACVGG